MIVDTAKLEHVYDQLIRSIVPKNSPIDWRLMKAVIKQESMFNPIATSKVGARGLMQLMPKTDQWLDGNMDGYDIYGNITDGHYYLTFLHGFWATRGIPEGEIISFILGSYNAGQGNILRTKELLKSKGLSHDRWVDIRGNLELITGPSNARETVSYVDNILASFQAYKGGA